MPKLQIAQKNTTFDRSVECGPRTSVSLAGLACSFQIRFRGKCHNQSNAVSGALACRRQGLRLCVCAFQQAEEIAVGGKDERRIFREHFPVCVHALEEIVEFGGLRILGVSVRINLGRFRVRFATDLLHLPVSGRLNFI